MEEGWKRKGRLLSLGLKVVKSRGGKGPGPDVVKIYLIPFSF